jgi:metallo-beta-lactamase family protein
MKISFHGACREITGSCNLVETGKVKFLVDCGLFQGRDFFTRKNFDPFDFDPKEIDFVLLTHAHLDHCGRLPKLYKEGFRGEIIVTPATRDLTEVILADSARVIAAEAGRLGLPPFYTEDDVLEIMERFETVEYRQEFTVIPEIKITARDAGHILGSAIFEIRINEQGQEKKIVFSGDLGNPPTPIIKDTEFIGGADAVIVESTYGGLTHEPSGERLDLLRRAVIESVGRGGVLMIPSFALERTQEVLYELNYLMENKKIPQVPIFVDSPLAIRATAVYKKYAELYDEESCRLIEAGDNLFNFPGLVYTASVEESKTINKTPPPKVIIAGSGMCTGGRMPHHLLRYLSDPKNHLLIISYQAEESLGRRLFDGEKTVTIENEKVRVRAKVSAIGAYSSHADQPKIMNWIKNIAAPGPEKIFINHGEMEKNIALKEAIEKEGSAEIFIPEYGKVYEI